MEQWRKDGELRLTEGQRVAHEVIIELRDCVPPAYYNPIYFQVGEPFDHDAEQPWKALFSTFTREPKEWRRKRNEATWIYRGICQAGGVEPRQGYGEKIRRAGI